MPKLLFYLEEDQCMGQTLKPDLDAFGSCLYSLTAF